jgi:hypothetical protein
VSAGAIAAIDISLGLKSVEALAVEALDARSGLNLYGDFEVKRFIVLSILFVFGAALRRAAFCLDNPRGARHGGRNPRAASLYSVGPA